LTADEVAEIERTKEGNCACMKADTNINLNSMQRVWRALRGVSFTPAQKGVALSPKWKGDGGVALAKGGGDRLGWT
jgi:hypothetical protein